MNEWATLQEAAEYFRVSTRTIRRWIADGTIKAERFGPKLIRVDISSIKTRPMGPDAWRTETSHLLASSANAEHLHRSIADLNHDDVESAPVSSPGFVSKMGTADRLKAIEIAQNVVKDQADLMRRLAESERRNE